ncbi:dTDP-4-dehydrorhamnose 3,5-epimerase [Prevotella sp. ne3005]|uniref:dTDP-4-dehydrorhamnose 3,5-epimerase family protein n=1 Tax=Prevotella sp. ne3005 TaxID=1761887 RepID=UPI0008AEA577|nr:dTDP-4-dehydrorhamnose 3,5-epimerase [Prevotella sp. ne3005]SEM54504.1 dTDP-4-dehydrorhamnose 3,5-epimerase [Prevotella sp. ne3005]
MQVIKTAIDGVVIIEPRIFEDSRGYFFESFSQRDFNEKVRPITFVQDNESKSSYGVMRGLHFQRPPFTQSKLVRCVKGAVLDVAVDIRKGSPTYGQHVECLLCAHDEEAARIAKEFAGYTFNGQCSMFNSQLGQQFFIPKGFAHGFAVLSETAVFQYKCDEFYHPEADGGISILDDSLGIDWRIKDKAILSEKDTKHPLLKVFDSPFDIKIDLY